MSTSLISRTIESCGGPLFFTDPFYKRPYWERKDEKPQLPQRVYRLASDYKKLTIAADNFRQPNGIVGDADKQVLLVADIGAGKTYRFKVDGSGALVDRQLFCEMGSDGMTLDCQGNVYLTGKAGVTVFNSEGKQIQVIAVPKGWTANVCFGGFDRKTLFITASDSVYTIAMDIAGLQPLITSFFVLSRGYYDAYQDGCCELPNDIACADKFGKGWKALSVELCR